MLLAPFSFQGNEKVYLECSKVRQEGGGGSVNNAEGAITISQSQIVKIRTPHLLILERKVRERSEQLHSSLSSIFDTCVIHSLEELLGTVERG